MTYRATRPPQSGGWDLLKEWASREFTRLQQALQRTPETSEGSITPTFTFATPGDLSNSYANQNGAYWRMGSLVFFSLTCEVTPTFTTSSGEARIDGLPFAALDNSGPRSVVHISIGSTGLTWPGSRTESEGLINEASTYIRLLAGGSGLASTTFSASDFTSATSVLIRASGFYPIK